MKLARFTAFMDQLVRSTTHWETCRKLGMLAEFTPEAFEATRACFTLQREYAAGETIVSEGEDTGELMLLLDGTARVSWRSQRRLSLLRGARESRGDSTSSEAATPTHRARLSAGSSSSGSAGASKLCCWLQQGDFFGDHGALMGTTRTATVTATSACVVAMAPRQSAQVLPTSLLQRLEAQRAYHLHASDELRLADLDQMAELGSGKYSAIMLMRNRLASGAEAPLALKVMRRRDVERAGQCAHVTNERDLLVQLRHPFVARCIGTIRDATCIMLATEYAPGGELLRLIREGPLTREASTFVLASVLLMIEHIHGRHYVYRDLKPENLMLAADGYLKLIDFGFTKRMEPTERTYTVCGTLEYMAPEIIALRGHGPQVDWWAAGVLFYECLHGHTPFRPPLESVAKNTGGSVTQGLAAPAAMHADYKIASQLLDNIQSPEFRVEFSASTSAPELVVLVSGLLRHEPSLRYGASEVRAAALFDGYDWQKLLQKQLRPPHVPTLEGEYDARHFQGSRAGGERAGADFFERRSSGASGAGEHEEEAEVDPTVVRGWTDGF